MMHHSDVSAMDKEQFTVFDHGMGAYMTNYLSIGCMQVCRSVMNKPTARFMLSLGLLATRAALAHPLPPPLPPPLPLKPTLKHLPMMPTSVTRARAPPSKSPLKPLTSERTPRLFRPPMCAPCTVAPCFMHHASWLQELAAKVPPEHIVRSSIYGPVRARRRTAPITPIRRAFLYAWCGLKAPLVQLLVLYGAPVMHNDFRHGHQVDFEKLLSWAEAELATRYCTPSTRTHGALRPYPSSRPAPPADATDLNVSRLYRQTFIALVLGCGVQGSHDLPPAQRSQLMKLRGSGNTEARMRIARCLGVRTGVEVGRLRRAAAVWWQLQEEADPLSSDESYLYYRACSSVPTGPCAVQWCSGLGGWRADGSLLLLLLLGLPVVFEDASEAALFIQKHVNPREVPPRLALNRRARHAMRAAYSTSFFTPPLCSYRYAATAMQLPL